MVGLGRRRGGLAEGWSGGGVLECSGSLVSVQEGGSERVAPACPEPEPRAFGVVPHIHAALARACLRITCGKIGEKP